MADNNTFPSALLEASPQQRKQYFRDYEVLHPRIQVIFDKVMRIIREPGGKQIIFVVGPTGVGKSFLINWLVSELRYEWSLLQETDPGRIPVAWMEVPAKDTKQPSWGDYYIRVLEALEERHIERKVLYGDVAVDVKILDGQKKVVVEDATIRKYRRANEECFKHRHPWIFLLDEAHQLVSTGGLRVEEQMENIKSIANMTKTLHGLLGTYKLLDLLSLDDDEESDQLIRRSSIFHFQRYLNNDEERCVFDSIIYSFQVNMPFKKVPDLIRHSDFIYERTCGCVGILRDWLVTAFTNAVDENAATLELRHLKRTCLLSKSRSIKMHQQFSRSEKDVEAVLDGDDDDFVAMVEKIASELLTARARYGTEKDERQKSNQNGQRKRGSKKPGKQNPKRREIGRRENQ